jgi:hypothetical protein
MQSFLLLLRSSLSSCVAVLSNLLLSGVRSRCQPLQSLLSASIFCLIRIGQSYVLNVSVRSGIVFQPAHCVVLLKNNLYVYCFDLFLFILVEDKQLEWLRDLTDNRQT